MQMPWFHGSPLRLDVLRAGSTITRSREVARIFSHKPSLVAHDEIGRVFHNGAHDGFLYAVQGVTDDDVYPHPETTMAAGIEWITSWEFALVFLEPTTPRDEERLDADEEESLWKRWPGLK